MKTYKQHPIVMLPTNEKSIIVKNTMSIHIQSESNLYLRQEAETTNPKNTSTINQHLYILSDDEIKEDDWIITDNIIGQVIGCIDDNLHEVDLGWSTSQTRTDCKKIIATTDTSLMLHDNSKNNKCFGTQLSGKCPHVLPQIPISFIKYFIKQYNSRPFAQDVITNVNVEYESNYKTVNPDNTINIKPIKDSYSRDEVIKIVRKFFNEALIPGQDKWIEQNL